MKPIRLVACDMDGTFLTSERQPHPQNILAVQKLVASGVIFCLASGRGISTMRPLLAQLNLTGPIVSSNGAFVICPNGSTVFDSVLENSVIEEVVNYAGHHNIHLNHYHHDTITFSQSGPHADLYQERTGCLPEFSDLQNIKLLPATKLLFIDSHQNISIHADYFLKHNGLKGTSIVRSEPDYLEFLPNGITKGVGLQKLAEHLGISGEECAAIGDWHNDKEMLEWVGYPAAVANAAPEIQAISKSVFASNNEAGVAEFIESVIEHNNAGIVIN
jgi:Cof subfamily protein (haloacid dehalogenase superfamily)